MVLLIVMSLRVNKYNYENIIRKVEKYLLLCSGIDWNEASMKVSRLRLGRWNF